MNNNGPKFTIGVEEEYLLVDQDTRAVIIDPPESLMKELEEACGPQVTAELLRSQVEIGTKVCNNIQEARAEIIRLRSAVKQVAMDDLSLRQAKEEVEKIHVEEALARHGGNISRTAKEIGVSRPTLYAFIKKYKIETN